jgi:hypothetical protein
MIVTRITGFLLAASLVACCQADEPAQAPLAERLPASESALKRLIESHCLDCHDTATKKAGLALDKLVEDAVERHPEEWEKVVRKLTARQMPPQGEPRPAEGEYDSAVSWLAAPLDAAAQQHPIPGRTETLRRLNRTEYQNAIRDLLSLDVDAAALLPPDESSHSFDNITVTDLSPTLLNRYISAAQKIARLAVGKAPPAPREDVFRMRPDITQDVHLAGLPIGTRGGIAIPYNFPQDGEYEIQVLLMRDRNDEVEGLHDAHELEISLDRERVNLFTVKPPGKGVTNQSLDANLKSRVTAQAGPHQVAVAFLARSESLLESTRQPLNVHFNFYRHPRLGPAVYQVSISGPFRAGGPGDTPSRRKVFVCLPTQVDEEEACAQRILSDLARRAYRRPVNEDDMKSLLDFYRQGRAEGDFESGIETALSAILVKPQFLFHIEHDPPDVPSGTAYRIDALELASRLAFFLWSSIPDDELLDATASGDLQKPEVLERQVRRMLADDRSRSLVTNFAGQWLHLRNLDAAIPDMRLFPDFDDNLRQAMRQETELVFESIIREDRSVLDLVNADYTYLNQRLAKHYGIPHVYGSRFRRITLDNESQRGGLLRQASVLTVTSYATRTSPVIRGKWVLENLLGSPPPPPPANVPALKDNTVLSTLSVRERLAEHRSNAACAGCHSLMDPVGFSLENFDAVGRWRKLEEGQPLDVSGGLPDGSEFTGVAGLERALRDRPELLVRTLTEKLMTFALGRGVEYYDAPAVRLIVRDAQADDYRFSRLILGIVTSTPFQMRRSP